MFKKVSKSSSNKHASRKRRVESDDDEADDETTAADADAQERLQATKKRRQLLTKLQYRRGVDARELLVTKKGTTDAETEEGAAQEEETAADLPGTTSAAPPEAKVWQDKHAAALESFVQERLRQQQQSSTTEKNTADASPNEETRTKAHPPSSKAALYQKLAVQAAQWAGKETQTTEGNPANDTSEVLAGAATALAEVVLPVRERLDAVAETAQAAAAAHSGSNIIIQDAHNSRRPFPTDFGCTITTVT